MEDVFPERRYLNLNHRPDRKFSFESQLSGQGLEVKRFAAMLLGCTQGPGALHGGEWGCALSHAAILEEAHAAGAEAVLIFEDDAVLHPQFREWCEAIALPDDWAVLYFGAQHTEEPVKVIAAGLVRCIGAYSAHAYAVRGPWLTGAAAAIREGIGAGIPCDVALAAFQKELPAYAFYPNLVWQAEGYSDIKQQLSRAYESGGVQRWHQPVLQRLDEEMGKFMQKQGM